MQVAIPMFRNFTTVFAGARPVMDYLMDNLKCAPFVLDLSCLYRLPLAEPYTSHAGTGKTCIPARSQHQQPNPHLHRCQLFLMHQNENRLGNTEDTKKCLVGDCGGS